MPWQAEKGPAGAASTPQTVVPFTKASCSGVQSTSNPDSGSPEGS